LSPFRARSMYLAAAVLVTELLRCGPAAAATSPAPAKSATTTTSKPATAASTAKRKPTVAELQRQIEDQRQQMEKAQAQLDAQDRMLQERAANEDSLRRSIEEMRKSITDLQRQLEFFASQVPDSAFRATLEQRLKQVEVEAGKPPELPPDTISKDFPGSFRIPGSDAAIKFGGRVRASFVLTLDPLGTDDRFLTNSIPVSDTAQAGEARRTNFSASTSRLNFEFRTPTGASQIRSFIEGDFASNVANTNAFRLRHAYAQYKGLILGQTWSTFSDPEINPQDLDFEGLSSENVIRQPQARFWWRNKMGARVAVAMETPRVSVDGGIGVNLIPDLVARSIWRDAKGGHLQLSGVVRQIRVQPTAFPGKVESDPGWGLSASGVFIIPQHKLEDRFAFQANGGVGIARYINDLNSLGGSDAAIDTTGNSRPLPAFGWYVDYEHVWANWPDLRDLKLRSCVLWSVVTVDNLDFQPPNAYHTTSRIAANVIFSPTTRIDLGLEYIYGTRENKDGSKAAANQIQLVSIFVF